MLGKTLNQQQRVGLRILNGLKFENFLFVVLSFILSKSVILGEVYPFAPAVLGAVSVRDKEKRWWVLIGVVSGSLVGKSFNFALSSILISLLIFIVLFKQVVVSRQQWVIVPVVVTAIVFIIKSSFILLGGNTEYSWVVAVFESIFAGLITLIGLTALGAWEKRKKNIELILEDKISCFIICMGLLLGLSDIQFASINIQSFISKAAVLTAAFLSGPGGGAAIGTMVGLVPCMNGSISTAVIGFYSLSGLLGGIFQGLGRIGVLIGFTLGNLMLSIYFNGQDQVIMTLFETMLAGGLFLALPNKIIDFSRTNVVEPEKNEQKEESSQKIKQISNVFYELSRAFCTQKEEAKKDDNPLNIILNRVAEQVCQRCSFSSLCWEKEFYKTYRSMLEVCSKAEKNKHITEALFPPNIKRRCMRLRELAVALDCQLEIYKKEKYYLDKLFCSQQMVSRQLGGMAELITGFAQELKRKETSDERLAEMIKGHLVDNNIKVQTVKVNEISPGDKEITIIQNACPEQSWCKHFIAPKLSQMLGRTYTVKEMRCPTAGNKNCTYHLNPSSTYSVTTGLSMLIKDGSTISGDSWACANLPNRRFAIILSDGMGAGAKANMESQTAVKLLERLLASGVSNQMSIDTVNSVLYLRSTEEIFATIDLTVINEVSATVEFIKIGAVPSFIKRRTQVYPIKAQSLPVGIFNRVEPELYTCPIQLGDIIINMTDGVFEALSGKIEEWTSIIKALPQDDPQVIADYLMELAKKSLKGQVKDDLTVIAARVDYHSD